MIRERHRREILTRLRTKRRFETLAKSAQWHYREKLRESYAEGATPTELAKLVGVSVSRIKQIIYDKEDN